MFRNPTFWLTVKNTLLYNGVFLVTNVVFPMSLALAINEVRSKKLARVFQTGMIMPHFISYVVVSVILFAIISADSGIVGHFYKNRGLMPIAFYSEPKYWPFFLIFIYVWRGTGYSSIIYLGSITGISDEYYEAAVIDGATKWQQIVHITLPFLKPMAGAHDHARGFHVLQQFRSVLSGAHEFRPALFRYEYHRRVRL